MKLKAQFDRNFRSLLGSDDNIKYVEYACATAVLYYENGNVIEIFKNFTPEVKSTHAFSKKPKEIMYSTSTGKTIIVLNRDSSVNLFVTADPAVIKSISWPSFDTISIAGKKMGSAIEGTLEVEVGKEKLTLYYDVDLNKATCTFYGLKKTDGYFSAIAKRI